MKDLFFGLTNILGKLPNDTTVMQLIDALGEAPVPEDGHGIGRFYGFPEHGFAIGPDVLTRPISEIVMYLTAPEDWKGFPKGTKAFTGDLASLHPTDDRETVRSKLNMPLSKTYMERRPTVPPEFSDEQIEAYVHWERSGEENDPPEIAKPVIDCMQKWEAMPNEIIVDVYDSGTIEWHCTFLIEDQRLIQVRLFLNSADALQVKT